MGKLDGKTVAILTENGFEEVELTSPKEALEKAGATVHIISPQKEKVKGWNHDHWSIELPVDKHKSKAKFDDYDSQTEQDLKLRAIYTIKSAPEWNFKSIYE